MLRGRDAPLFFYIYRYSYVILLNKKRGTNMSKVKLLSYRVLMIIAIVLACISIVFNVMDLVR